jgi:hypothetical protein
VHFCSYNAPMRWTDFFSHLEYDFALEAEPSQQSSDSPHNTETQCLDVCARAKAQGRHVTVALVTGDVFHVSPRAVGTDWVSGVVGGEQGAGVVIPLGAVVWIECDGVSSHGQKTSLVAATLSDVITDIARREARITLRTVQSDTAGVIVGVGKDFLDVASQPAGRSSVARRFPLHAVVAIFQGSVAWG